jgi:hypothetical protein
MRATARPQGRVPVPRISLCLEHSSACKSSVLCASSLSLLHLHAPSLSLSPSFHLQPPPSLPRALSLSRARALAPGKPQAGPKGANPSRSFHSSTSPAPNRPSLPASTRTRRPASPSSALHWSEAIAAIIKASCTTLMSVAAPANPVRGKGGGERERQIARESARARARGREGERASE